MFVVPLLTTLVFLALHKQHVGPWLAKQLRLQRSHIRWYVAALSTLPVIILSTFFITNTDGQTLTVDPLTILVLIGIFLFSGVCEQLGWTAYALPLLRQKMNAFAASLVLGAVWAAWHIIPYMQGQHTAEWILGQLGYTVALRVLLTWVYEGGNKNLWLAVLLQASSNVSASLLPGTSYNPVIVAGATWGIIALAAAMRRASRRRSE